MSSNIQYHRYVLKSEHELNALSKSTEVEGCLIRVGAGVGCIHPWVELGDEPVQEQLDALRDSLPLRLGRRALQCASLDGEARERGESLFAGLSIPESHLTVSPGMDLAKQELGLFSRIKIKGTTDLQLTRQRAQECLARAADDALLRVDFNACLDTSLAMNLAQMLGADVCARIEFIEDPVDFDCERWQSLRRQTALALAVDRDCEAAIEQGGGADWVVFKPAVVDALTLAESLAAQEDQAGWVVTSYMDHAIGQMFAAYQAAVLKQRFPQRIGQCGLLTHGLFERDEFFEAVQHEGSKLLAPEGTGLGFDESLKGLQWKCL